MRRHSAALAAEIVETVTGRGYAAIPHDRQCLLRPRPARRDRQRRARQVLHQPRVGLVLGSGLGAFGDTLDDLVKIPYHELPHLPQSKVVGHSGNLCFGKVNGVPVVCVQAHSPLRGALGGGRGARRARSRGSGSSRCSLTNAAGGIEPEWAPGDLMVLTDHLDLTGHNPLVGPNDDALGPRFPDMSAAYDPKLRGAAHHAAREAGFSLREGVYAGLLGPTQRPPPRCACSAPGAQAVGMSTVLDTIALRHMKVRVGALSCITNLAAGLSKTELDHSEVEQTARGARERLTALLRGWIQGAAA
ncbi:MAG: purine-nucleoside phosphorylase [Myxococcales bacterium]|nr:purine-nucleoside phosphorylase [Myxococcales bacterium]